MDRASRIAANALAGAPSSSASIEIGPGPFTIEVLRSGTIAFAGAPREGAKWWTTLEVSAGDTFELSPCVKGVWSYLAMSGGFSSPPIMGSRSTCVREGIGRWLSDGDLIDCESETIEPEHRDELEMNGPVRLEGTFSAVAATIGARVDRMGYELVGFLGQGGESEALSEPTFPGFIQALPNGNAFVLMSEAPTLGGYPVVGVVHPDDLRFVAQSRPGDELHLVPQTT